jgi:hypothetical protein
MSKEHGVCEERSTSFNSPRLEADSEVSLLGQEMSCWVVDHGTLQLRKSIGETTKVLHHASAFVPSSVPTCRPSPHLP